MASVLEDFTVTCQIYDYEALKYGKKYNEFQIKVIFLDQDEDGTPGSIRKSAVLNSF